MNSFIMIFMYHLKNTLRMVPYKLGYVPERHCQDRISRLWKSVLAEHLYLLFKNETFFVSSDKRGSKFVLTWTP
jgi:hypothetical protein